jgi:hypothetical protein
MIKTFSNLKTYWILQNNIKLIIIIGFPILLLLFLFSVIFGINIGFVKLIIRMISDSSFNLLMVYIYSNSINRSHVYSKSVANYSRYKLYLVQMLSVYCISGRDQTKYYKC